MRCRVTVLGSKKSNSSNKSRANDLVIVPRILPFTHSSVYLLRLHGSERRGFVLQCFSLVHTYIRSDPLYTLCIMKLFIMLCVCVCVCISE